MPEQVVDDDSEPEREPLCEVDGRRQSAPERQRGVVEVDSRGLGQLHVAHARHHLSCELARHVAPHLHQLILHGHDHDTVGGEQLFEEAQILGVDVRPQVNARVLDAALDVEVVRVALHEHDGHDELALREELLDARARERDVLGLKLHAVAGAVRAQLERAKR